MEIIDDMIDLNDKIHCVYNDWLLNNYPEYIHCDDDLLRFSEQNYKFKEFLECVLDLNINDLDD